jgi:hypothetical protein
MGLRSFTGVTTLKAAVANEVSVIDALGGFDDASPPEIIEGGESDLDLRLPHHLSPTTGPGANFSDSMELLY